MPTHSSDRDSGAIPGFNGTTQTPANGDAPRVLTDRQIEILSHVARGRSNRQVGEALGISELTVRNHMRTIGKRLTATDRTHAVVLAIGHGWINIPIEPETTPSRIERRPAERGR